MLNFLKGTRKLLTASEPLCLIIGNESCDLDSAVCALSLAYYYQQRQQQPVAAQQLPTKKRHFLPILNIKRRDFALKTEVVYILQQQQISVESLTFRDELQQLLLDAGDIILVDHHVSPLAKQCVQVYDHRPFDAAANLPAGCQLTLQTVGSCATLIADTILQQNSTVADRQQYASCLRLLHAAIVMDTVNFAAAAGRTTAQDERVAAEIEQLLGFSDVEQVRQCLFRELCAAREDVSALSALQLLYKDMKLVENAGSNVRIALPGQPTSLLQFVCKPEAAEAVQQFAKEQHCDVVLLIGMQVQPDGGVKRDIGLINISNETLFDAVLKSLLEASEPELRLVALDECSFMGGKFYQQMNVKATRKHILPIVKNVLMQWK